MSKKILYIQKNFPGIELAKESLEMALAATSLDLEIHLFFMGDGIFQLLKQQEDNHLSAMLKALPVYGIDKVYVMKESLEEKKLVPDDLIIPIITVPLRELGELLNEYTIVLS